MSALAETRTTPYQHTVAQQNSAASPAASVWLAASAGTGKTEVLSRRLLRLLLDGCEPQSILCLTYTKAAAAEMANRLSRVLTRWVTLPNEGADSLTSAFATIGLTDPAEGHFQRARELFAVVLDCPGGLRIQTVHSYCQELLQRFPLEAGQIPHFTVLDEVQEATLRDAALTQLLHQVSGQADAQLATAFGTLMDALGEHNFRTLLNDNLRQWQPATDAQLADTLGVQPGATAAQALQQAVAAVDEWRADLQQAAQVYLQYATDSKKPWGQAMAGFLAADAALRQRLWGDYVAVFLTQKGEPKAASTLYPKDLQARLPRLPDIMTTEAQRVLRAVDSINAASIYELTRSFDVVATRFQTLYRQAKQRQGVVDYDDLIAGAEDLLQNSQQAEWVRYKLDDTLQHVLVDEAQDTSPQQWRILRALVDEFINDPADAPLRTLFVVGDEKQSIYSFQGADPQAFQDEYTRYKKDFGDHEKPFNRLSLSLSFRSAQAVLDAVNHTFAPDAVRAGVSDDVFVQQESPKSPPAGTVQAWPLLVRPEAPERAPWHLPLAREAEVAPAAQLADLIAQRIAGWLADGALLPGTSRRMTPGDIMILLQKRTTLMDPVVRALKQYDIPVAGIDKMQLTAQLAVQDLLALINFVLLPGDDLNLASLLKTPLCGVGEDDLFAICHGRGEGVTVWQRLQQAQPAVADYLNGFRALRGLRPYEFLQTALRNPCPANARSGLQAFRARLGDEVLDPLHELLQAALAYEQNNTPGLQAFAQTMAHLAVEKKRDLSEASGKVRVMTVHASKGLQAPVVILADAAGMINRSKQPQLLRDAAHPDQPMLFVPRTGLDNTVAHARRTAYWQRQEQEYRRLLYVAMTRAEEQLIICGTTNRTDGTAPAGSWYDLAHSALQAMPGTVTLDDGTMHYYAGTPRPPEAQDEKAAKAQQNLPIWADRPIAGEAAPARPLAPGRIMQPDVAYASPLDGADDKRFMAGIITHRMLELLPGKTVAQQQVLITKLTASYENELSPTRLQQVVDEVQAILHHPEFAPLFGPGSLAEVPLVGMIDGQPISGQVDRLLVTDDAVLVVDYKTNRPPPRDVDAVDDAYIVQLACYVNLLKKLYPSRIVKAALLWTDGPHFMPIPADKLSK